MEPKCLSHRVRGESKDKFKDKIGPIRGIHFALNQETYTFTDSKNQVRKFTKGKLLGKGTISKYYEFTETNSIETMAAKIIPRASLSKGKAREKLLFEIRIQKSLQHPNIVQFKNVFEDNDNIFVLFELCSNGSLKELIRRRKRLEELEARYYLLQLVHTLRYLNDKNLLHRNLTLDNILINEDMTIKITDFTDAVELVSTGEYLKFRPDFMRIAPPEVLDARRGESYTTEVWHLGTILYTLLVGRHPFEAADFKETYKNIKKNIFMYPDNSVDIQLSEEATDLIAKMLNPEPSIRPSLEKILQHPFITNGEKIPKILPSSTLVTALSKSNNPFNTQSNPMLQPLLDQNFVLNLTPRDTPRDRPTMGRKLSTSEKKKLQIMRIAQNYQTPIPTSHFPEKGCRSTTNITNEYSAAKMTVSTQSHFWDSASTNSQTTPRSINLGMSATEHKKKRVDDLVHDKENDADITVNLNKVRFFQEDTYVKQWIDDPTNPGLVYVLSTGAVGLLFHDTTQMVLDPKKLDFTYIKKRGFDKGDIIKQYSLFHYPVDLREKVTVLLKFMKELTRKSQEKESLKEDSKDDEVIFIKRMLKTHHATMFRFNRNLFQVRFHDTSELLLNYDQKVITYQDKKGTRSQHALEKALESTDKGMIKRLNYITNVLADVHEKKKLEKVQSCADFLHTQ